MRLNQQDEEDRAILTALEQLPPSQRAQLEASRPKDLAHYMAAQRPWVEDEIYFLGIALHHSPTDAEIAEHILQETHSQRFRIYYALRYPDRVALQAG